MSDASSFETVWSAELEAIRGPETAERRARERAHAERLFGISLSGGGIRSATFNLGMLQALAAKKLLGRADYLSINSGGGYIGSWLLAWIKRQGIDRVQHELARVPGEDPSQDDDVPEAKPVSFLRGFSNYLTPKVGLFSADTWMVVATYARNLILNLTILIAALSALLLVPRAVLAFSEYLNGTVPPWVLLLVAALFLVIGAFTTGLNTFRLWAIEQPEYATQAFIQKTVVLPLFAAAWVGVLGARLSDEREWGWVPEFLDLPAWWPAEAGWNWLLIPALVYLIPWLGLRVGAWLLGRKAEHSERAPNRARMWRAVLWSAPAAGALGGVMLWGLNSLAEAISREFRFEQSLIHVTVWGTPLLIGVMILTAVFHIGLVGRAFSEHERQWWSRLGAWMLIYSVAWVGLFGAVFYGPVIIIWVGSLLAGMLGVGWLVTTIGGVLAGKSQQSGNQSAGKMRSLLTAAAPSVFVIGLLLLLATGLHGGLDKLAGSGKLQFQSSGQPAAFCQRFWPQPRAEDDDGKQPHASDLRVIADCHAARIWVATDRYVVVYILALLAIAIWFSSRVDINAFSMHLFYRSRLIRAYLGASNPGRDPNKFTGFDPRDDVGLSELRPRPDQPDNRYDGPYPILNAALNLVAGDELAWQERKAASFVFTPKYSGFRTAGDVDRERAADQNLDRNGFRATSDYDHGRGISLGTAMAISGAAISPSMGAQSSAAMAFLLTVFNVRLGWWLGNPRRSDTALRLGPKVGLMQLLDELFGQTNERAGYVYLSDGGHFENLALYELVRRRCRFIIVSDAGADPKMIFSDLGNAIRKCRTDFGIDIEFGRELDNLRPAEGTRFSRHHCAIGTIHYERADPGAKPGILLYLKASLNRDEPEDVQNYAASSAEFPHEATVDQWFSESQFESYRALGRHIGDTVLAAARGDQDIGALFAELERTWRGQPTAP